MLLKVSLLLCILQYCTCIDLIYSIDEGMSPGTFLGDIVADTRLMDGVPFHDQDLIRFSQLQQGVTGGSQFFNVSESTGMLYTAQTLDAESLCEHNTECFLLVNIAVQRGQSFMKILKIKVIIEDVNDHAPEFPDKQINLQFSEDDHKGTRESIPSAIDRDVGILNSRIIYYLKNNTNLPFGMSVSNVQDGTSEISIFIEEKLDREYRDSYTVQVAAQDGGKPPKETILEVHVMVKDENDNPPVFSQDAYNVSIKNEIFTSEPVVAVSATDADIGKNGQISYYFSSQTSIVARYHFKMNKTSGVIYLNRKLIPNQNIAYKLFVKAMDGGHPRLSALADVLVNVVNIRNHAPKIFVDFVSSSTKNTAAISEGVKVGSFIAYVMVTDNDIGQNGEVSCELHHEKFQLQSLGRKEYKVIVKNPVDRETKDRHDITITCQDKGTPPMRTKNQFFIHVIDVNDVAPQFSKNTFKFWTYENQKPNFPVGFINGTDPDVGSGGQLTYSLLVRNESFPAFHITNYGFISTTKSLDREQQEIYKFQVFVRDHGMPCLNNTVNVIVEVMDENDNVPYFTFPSINPFNLDVHYHSRNRNNITVLKAIDKDSRENAFLKYEILRGNDRQLFTLNKYSGSLSFSRMLTQRDAGLYKLQLVVTDSGSPALSSVTNLSLTLSVSNDTSKTLTAIQITPDVRIHKNLLIVIVLISVTASIAIVVLVTICLVKREDHKRTAWRNKVDVSNRLRGQRHLKCLPLPAIPQFDIPIAETSSQRKSWNMQMADSSRDQQYEIESLCEPSSPSPVHFHALSPLTHQVHIQRVKVRSGDERVTMEQGKVVTHDCCADVSTKTFITDEDDQCWIEGDLDAYNRQHYMCSQPHTDQWQINSTPPPQQQQQPPQPLQKAPSDSKYARVSIKPTSNKTTFYRRLSGVKAATNENTVPETYAQPYSILLNSRSSSSRKLTRPLVPKCKTHQANIPVTQYLISALPHNTKFY